MKIDSDKIINETIAAFEYSGAANLYRKCTDVVDAVSYKQLHPTPLTPLNIKIDAEAFNNEIKQWSSAFEQWGNNHTHLPRYGAALVNKDGTLLKDDPTNGSLMAWNQTHATDPLIETDCCTPTAIMSLPSLTSLSVFNEFWCRSNVLKWDKDAMFVPHIDTIVPSMWIRLWATMSPNVVVRFAQNGELVPATFEVGRVYIIDTSLVHDAFATDDTVYQLFLSVVPNATTILQTLQLRSE